MWVQRWMIWVCLSGLFVPCAWAADAVAPVGPLLDRAAVAPTSTSVASPEAACAALATADFLEIPDAPTSISHASVVPATQDIPAFCKVVAVTAPDVGFEIDMPLQAWNGRLLMQGCGGTCGIVSTAGCQDVAARGFSVVQTDMGHRGKPIVGAAWADHNLQGIVDFGYRATHVSLVAAKVIEQTFYGRAARYTYYRGCSTGGRQGMVEAQRFPDDFDGIIAIAPPLNETGIAALHLVWTARASNRRDGTAIIDGDDVRRVHSAVLAACDADDGVKDGVIGDPQTCRFNVTSLACHDGDTHASDGGACLSPDKVKAFERIYGGAQNSSGQKIFPGGMPLGSEMGWFPYFVSPDGGKARVLDPNWLIGEFLRYMAFYEPQNGARSIFDFDFDRDPTRLGLMEAFYNADNPDLRAFAAHGGKLIMADGWADPLVPPASVIDYEETAVRALGGDAAARKNLRLFMVPGMEHCVGGHTEDAVDYLSALQQWVEAGKAPDRLIAYQTKTPQTLLKFARFPLSRDDWVSSRSLYPYPDTARFDGQGDPTDAANWVRVTVKR